MVGMSVSLYKLQQLVCLVHIHLGSCPERACFVTKMSELLVAPSTLITQPSQFFLKNPILSLRHQIKKRMMALLEDQTITACFASLPSQFLQERVGARDWRCLFAHLPRSITPQQPEVLMEVNCPILV